MMKARHAAMMAGLALGLMSGVGAAVATPIVYDISGVASGTYGTRTFSDVGFDLQFKSNTDTVQDTIFGQQNSGLTFITIDGVVDNYSLGNQNTFFVSTFIVPIAGVEANNQGGNVFSVSADFFNTYDLTQSAPKTPVEPFVNAIDNFPVNGKSLTVTNVSDLSFSATLSSVSAVPLPASAPMFGAALVALGAVGYAAKRKKEAAA